MRVEGRRNVTDRRISWEWSLFIVQGVFLESVGVCRTEVPWDGCFLMNFLLTTSSQLLSQNHREDHRRGLLASTFMSSNKVELPCSSHVSAIGNFTSREKAPSKSTHSLKARVRRIVFLTD